MFLELLKKYKEQFGIKIFAYALMPNHLHLLIEIPEEDRGSDQTTKPQEISDFMHSLNNGYTKYFNSRYERRGHLFGERFKSALVEKEKYLLKMTAYIHLNPQKLNLVVDAKDYPYSSFPAYLYYNTTQQENWLNLKTEIDEVFKVLGNNDYAGFVAGMTEEEGQIIHKRLYRGGILGSDDFVKDVKSQIEAYKKQGAGQRIEVDTQRYKILIATGSFLILLLIGATGAYLYFVNRKSTGIKENKMPIGTVYKPEDLSTTEWQIKLVPASGGGEAVDTLIFKNGKFISAKLNSLGFPSSNYSVTLEDGRLVWETMQTALDGTVSWRGEIEQGKMRGIMSLRQEGKAPQDFSFMSVLSRRK